MELVPIEKEHLRLFMEWRNKYRQYLRQPYRLDMSDQETWHHLKKDLIYSVFDGDRIVGAAGLCYLDLYSRKAELSLILENYIDKRSHLVINLVLDMAFNDLGLHKVYCEVFGNDLMKADELRKYGFVLDGKIRDNYYWNGEYFDSMIFSILRKEWKT